MARQAKTGTEAVNAINERIQEYSLCHCPVNVKRQADSGARYRGRMQERKFQVCLPCLDGFFEAFAMLTRSSGQGI